MQLDYGILWSFIYRTEHWACATCSGVNIELVCNTRTTVDRRVEMPRAVFTKGGFVARFSLRFGDIPIFCCTLTFQSVEEAQKWQHPPPYTC